MPPALPFDGWEGQPGRFTATGTDGNDSVEITVVHYGGPSNEGIDHSSKILIYISGCGGFHNNSFVADPPQAAIIVKISASKYYATNSQKRKHPPYEWDLPDFIIKVIEQIRRVADSAPVRRKVILFGFSRGGKWGMELARRNASLVDFLWLFAGCGNKNQVLLLILYCDYY